MRINDFPSRYDLFIDWIIENTQPHARVLDIGANNGKFCPQVERIAAHASYMCGVDPDGAKLAVNPFVHERHSTVLEQAPLARETFDVAYSIFVVEHVEHPDAFMSAAHRALKPGASMYLLTPNANHYFAAISGTLGRMGLQDRVLKTIMSKEHAEDYHYPALYRMNKPSVIDRLAQNAGFSHVEYRYSEDIRDLDVYFPSITKIAPRMWQSMVRLSGKENLLCNLMARVVK